MNSRERINLILNHEKPDYIPLDLGGSPITGMHVSSIYKLRQALSLDKPGTPVKVINPYEMLGEIKPDLMEVLKVDVVSLMRKKNNFGFENENWKLWKTFDGTPVLVPEKFNTEPDENGDIYMYPQGDKSVSPCAKMPKDGYYFDILSRQNEPINDNNLNVEDNFEEFNIISEEELKYLGKEVDRLYNESDKAIFANFGGTSFGDAAQVPAAYLKNPKGIRDIEEWYVSLVARQDYIYKIFEYQCNIALKNLKKIYEVVGNKISLVLTTGTDFGGQDSLLISPRTYRDLFKPFYKLVNNWIHKHTTWKSFIHSDGSIMPLMEDLIESGFDVLNPVQWTAANMNPEDLKYKFGDRLVFWGGGVDTQKTLPFGTPREVKEEVTKLIKILGENGGFVFSTVHNVQACTPIENILAMYEAYEASKYIYH